MGGGSRRYSRRERSFEEAVRFNHLEEAEKLLSKSKLFGGKDANEKFSDGSAPLHLAAANGAIQMMMLLLRHGAEIDVRDGKGRTPLMTAVSAGKIETVSYLLKKDANISLPDNEGVIPLCRGAETGNGSIVDMLLEDGAPVDSRDVDGRTPLMAAAQKGHSVLVGSLSGYGASCTTTDGKGNTPMHYEAKGAANDVTLQFLAGKGDLVNRPNAAGETPLIAAVDSHNMDNVQTLIELGADPAQADKSGADAMQHARVLRRVKFRSALTEILQRQGEAIGRGIKAGTDHQVSVSKPLTFKRAAPKA
jgi:uncharacterized protein